MIVIRTYNLQSLKRDPSTDECYSARARRVNRDQDDKKKKTEPKWKWICRSQANLNS